MQHKRSRLYIVYLYTILIWINNTYNIYKIKHFLVDVTLTLSGFYSIVPFKFTLQWYEFFTNYSNLQLSTIKNWRLMVFQQWTKQGLFGIGPVFAWPVQLLDADPNMGGMFTHLTTEWSKEKSLIGPHRTRQEKVPWETSPSLANCLYCTQAAALPQTDDI